MPNRPSRHDAAQGFALIEALIAILIFSLGALGLVGLQASLTRATTSAKFRADAAYLAQGLIGQMWSDSTNLSSYNNCATYAPCKAWYDKVSAALPSAVTEVLYVSSGRVTITIQWTMPGEGSRTFSTSSSINP